MFECDMTRKAATDEWLVGGRYMSRPRVAPLESSRIYIRGAARKISLAL